MARFNLPLRLIGLLAAALIPAMAAMLYIQIGFRQERIERVTDGALHQAQLMSADIETLIGAARQLTVAVAQLDAVRGFRPGCTAQLEALRQSLDSYALLEVVNAGGQVICATPGLPTEFAPASLRTQIAAALAAKSFSVGRYAPIPDGAPVLPMFQPFAGPAGQRGVVIAGLDLNWLQFHLGRFHQIASNSLNLSDNSGTIIMRLPDPRRWRGQKVVAGAQDIVNADQPGIRNLIGHDGMPRIIGYVPAPLTGGVFVSYGVYVPDALVAINEAARRGYVLIAVCAVLSVLMMLVITNRLVHAPTEALLSAAQRWSDGDLAARARLNVSDHNEFGRLAVAFNTMAEALDSRRHQLEELNTTLEARVAERTHSLSEVNNRLQVEITERERTDAALRQAQKLQAIGHLAGGMAHEFNNLLTAVMGSLELLRLRLGLEAPLQRYVGSALEAAQRGARLTSQLLAFARRRRLMPVAVQLNTVLDEMRDLLDGSLGRLIELRFDPSPDVAPAMADRHEVEAAILNLALNAKDAIVRGAPSAGVIRIATRNAILSREPGQTSGVQGDFVELVVADNGIGMTEEQLAQAVNPFYTTKGPGEGAGLGLSQVHGFAQQLGGDLRISSQPGEGTTVCLFLPRAAAMAEIDLSPERYGELPSNRALLLVDDDDQVRQIAAAMLTELGYEVTVAGGGAEALELIGRRPNDNPFVAMVADYSMPGMSGIELIRRARRLHRNLITLMITGYMDLAGAPDADALEPREVLRKPFTLGELSRRIKDLSSDRVAEAVD